MLTIGWKFGESGRQNQKSIFYYLKHAGSCEVYLIWSTPWQCICFLFCLVYVHAHCIVAIVLSFWFVFCFFYDQGIIFSFSCLKDYKMPNSAWIPTALICSFSFYLKKKKKFSSFLLVCFQYVWDSNQTVTYTWTMKTYTPFLLYCVI